MTRFKLFFFIFYFFSVRLSGRIAAAGGDVQTNLRSAEEKGKKKYISNICESTSGKKRGGKSSIFFVPQKTNTLDAHI